MKFQVSELTEVILTMICVALIGLFFGAVLFGWLAGCGEHYIDAKGRTHNIECFKEQQQ